MQRLFSPWRSKYIATFKEEKTDDTCLFCTMADTKKDVEHFILLRKKRCFAVMNLYPYNSGHVMIVPYRHVASFRELSAQEHAEMMKTSAEMMDALSSVVTPHGFNFGANIGRVAGAGIDQHIHFHIVPRWNGDTNFMPVLADVKMISEDMKTTYRRLRNALKK